MDDYYDTIAEGYEKLHGSEQRKKMEMIKMHFSPNMSDRLLDIGCGTGLSSDWDCQVIGLDPSWTMLDKYPWPKVQGTGENLPFIDKSFDHVVCLTAVHHMGMGALDEIGRVCKNIIIISILKKSEKYSKIKKAILDRFRLEKEIDDMADTILILKAKP